MQNRSSLMSEIFFALCKTVDTPVSLGAWLRFQYNQEDLCKMSLKPRDYTSSDAFASDYAITSFLSKWKGLKTGLDLSAITLQGFATSETKCQETNQALDRLLSGNNPRLHAILHRAQRKIAALLGPFSYDKVLRGCRWGKGATQSLRRDEAYLDQKISERPLPVTSGALPYLRAWIECDYHWASVLIGQMPEGPFTLLPCNFKVVEGNRLVMVAKNAKTHRMIAAEPTGNSFLQQGVGRYIRKRLKRFGIDLDNQEINQVWASLARDLDLATLDLKAASDTLAKKLVELLLPLDWWLYLDALRSHEYYHPTLKSWVKAEKFSSMGNAFTFELESLIFWALCTSTLEHENQEGITSVYGDDLIVPQSSARACISTLTSLGFDINEEKSYVDGVFFESCGKHYFEGQDVTPAYQKEVVTNFGDLGMFRLANRLFRLSNRTRVGRLANAALNARHVVRRRAKAEIRDIVIPPCEADDGFNVDIHEIPYDWCENHGFYCRVLYERPRKRAARGDALLANWFRSKLFTRDTSEASSSCNVLDTGGSEPFWGLLPRRDRGAMMVTSAHRWIIPSWSFEDPRED